jgi:hypothetical protein
MWFRQAVEYSSGALGIVFWILPTGRIRYMPGIDLKMWCFQKQELTWSKSTARMNLLTIRSFA